MKIIIYSLLISILLQSCYSYKAIDLKTGTSLKEGKIYKINNTETLLKGKLISSNDTIIKLQIDKNEKQIPTTEVKEIKERKFSILKTVGLVPIIYAGVTIVYVLSALSRL